MNFIKGKPDFQASLLALDTRGFNIVYGNVWTGDFFYYQNKNDGQIPQPPVKLLKNKVYGLSNGTLDEWDKVERGKDLFQGIMEKAEEEITQFTDPSEYLVNALGSTLMTDLLMNDQKASWSRIQTGSGYPKIWEFLNSSIFVRNTLANFCTVSSTVFCLHKSGKAIFHEQRYRHSNNKCMQLLSSLNMKTADYAITTEVKE